MDKLAIYNAGRSVPEDARKPIKGGRLNGFTNINPMYRIKRLTELFGPCGTGWWYEITDRQLQPLQSGEIFCFVDINLYYKTEEGEVSRAIPGTGGSSFISSTKNGLQVSDECYKMALTDAISVAAKALGIGADVYWQEDSTKYGSFGGDSSAGMNPNTGYYPTQDAYVQPQQVYQQPSAPVVQQSVASYTGHQPEFLSLDQAQAVTCSVGYQTGKTLGTIMREPKALEYLDFIARMAPSATEKQAALLLRQSIIM